MIKSFFLGFFMATSVWLSVYIGYQEYLKVFKTKVLPVPVVVDDV